MLKPEVYHVGYHKTGSTFLQRRIFAAKPDLFLRVPQQDIFERFIYPTPLEFSAESARELVATYKQQAAAEGQVCVFSNERLSGGPHTGGYDSSEIAWRIAHCAECPRVIIVIREQRNMIYSLYSQYIKAYASLSLDDYLATPGPHRNETFRMSFLMYDKLIEKYLDLFNDASVRVLPYEMLKTQPAVFIRTVLEFCRPDCDIDDEVSTVSTGVVNQKLSPSQLMLKRYLNPFCTYRNPTLGKTFYGWPWESITRSLVRSVGAMKRSKMETRLSKKMQDKISEKTRGLYTVSNVRTSSRIGIDLRQYGYM
jgi:hypothetical protein